jgi:hypothetical protein
MDIVPGNAYDKIWELGAVAVILVTVIIALVSGKLVPGYLYKEKVDDIKTLKEQLNKTLELANAATKLSEDATERAERQLDELKYRLAKE